MKVNFEDAGLKSQLNFSGGKDSTAMLLRLIELGIRPSQIVFADTLMEFPEMYAYIDKIEQVINQKIIRVKPENTFLEWFFGEFTKGKMKGQIRGFPFVVTPCWYQREAKSKPLEKMAKTCDIIYVGYSKGEEKRVMDSPRFRYPLIEWGWTEEDCVIYLKERGLLNPLYSKFKRLGCWCCPKQTKESLDVLKRDYPSLWNVLLQLEKMSTQGFNPKQKLMIVGE